MIGHLARAFSRYKIRMCHLTGRIDRSKNRKNLVPHVAVTNSKNQGLYMNWLCLDEVTDLFALIDRYRAALSQIAIFNSNLRNRLDTDEKVIADSGYRGDGCLNLSGSRSSNDYTQSKLRARHEYFNKRLKHFNVIKRIFRHNRSIYGS